MSVASRQNSTNWPPALILDPSPTGSTISPVSQTLPCLLGTLSPLPEQLTLIKWTWLMKCRKPTFEETVGTLDRILHGQRPQAPSTVRCCFLTQWASIRPSYIARLSSWSQREAWGGGLGYRPALHQVEQYASCYLLLAHHWQKYLQAWLPCCKRRTLQWSVWWHSLQSHSPHLRKSEQDAFNTNKAATTNNCNTGSLSHCLGCSVSLFAILQQSY